MTARFVGRFKQAWCFNDPEMYPRQCVVLTVCGFQRIADNDF